jgi:uncharacterized small protein (DUF1192 family)
MSEEKDTFYESPITEYAFEVIRAEFVTRLRILREENERLKAEVAYHKGVALGLAKRRSADGDGKAR